MEGSSGEVDPASGASAPALPVGASPAAVTDALLALDDGLVLVIEPGGRIAHAAGATALLGATSSALVGLDVRAFVHADDAVAFAAALTQCAADPSGARASLQCRVQARDGGLRWLDVTVRNALDEAGLRGLVVRARDVTCDREVEAQHRRRGELLDALQAAIFNSDLGFWEWDLAHDRLRWLNDWPHEYGIPPLDGAGHFAQLLANSDPADHARVMGSFAAHMEGRAPRYEAEYRIRALDGSWRWITVRGKIVERASDGSPQRVVGTAFDVDRRKRLEEALERRRLQFEAIASNVPAWLLLTDPELRVEFVNRTVFGVEPAQLVGRTIEQCVGPEAATVFARHHRVAVATGRAVRFTATLDRGRRVLDCHLEPVIDGGVVVGVASNIAEVTDRLALERAVLEISSREQRRFASDLHDGLGQELTGIALHIRGLLRQAQALGSPLARELEEVLGYANGAITTARQIARGVSPFAQEAGGLRRAIEDLGARMSGDGGPSVVAEVGESVPCDLDPMVAEHLYRIAQEAVANAVRHAGAAGIRVTLDLDPAGDWLRLTVLDDGRGLPASAEQGPGLGLKLMRYRTEQIGGILRVRRSPAGGTRIDVTCARGPGGPMPPDDATLPPR
jgi:PAS domain S-box-containing protein